MNTYFKHFFVFSFFSISLGLTAAPNTQSSNKSVLQERWLTSQGRYWESQEWVYGDFNGDGADDTAQILKDGRNVSIVVYASNRKAFTAKPWAVKSGRYWEKQRWLAGDFNGDGADDIAQIVQDGRQVSIVAFMSKKDRFEMKPWVAKVGRYWKDQNWLPGDYNGDGIDDIIQIFKDGRGVSMEVYLSKQ